MEEQNTQKSLSIADLISEVDAEFWRRNPELRGRKLTDKAEDSVARIAWNDLLVRRLMERLYRIRNERVIADISAGA